MESWTSFFNQLTKDSTYSQLVNNIDLLYQQRNIYPAKEHMYQAFELTPINEIKVVIIGQDPYHQEGQAHGLAFSVMPEQPLPPSLRNIFKEIESDTGALMNYKSGHLAYLSMQGVLLLNTLLTVEANKPLSHKGMGYEFLIQSLFNHLDTLSQPIVFMLWGSESKKYQHYITHKNRLILTAHHPSPLSANRGGWFGCKHFSKTNTYLEKNGLKKIIWKNT